MPSGRPSCDFDLQDVILHEISLHTGIDRRGRRLEDVLAQEPDLISTELLLRCALSALRPFVRMMSDILKTLASAGAQPSGSALRVRFALSESGDPIEQTLHEFRAVIERIPLLLPFFRSLSGPRNAPVAAHNRNFEIQNLLVTTVGDRLFRER